MRMDKLTSRFAQALQEAQSLALVRDHNLIEPAHLLSALLDQQGGGTRPLLAQAGGNVVLLREEDGQPRELVAVIEDISERQRMQEAMSSARAAERASKAKTEFLSRMSHELRTPLNAMLGFAQLLRVDPRHPLHDDQRTKVAHIERAGAHLLAMLTDVLDLSRIEAGSMPIHLAPVSVQQAQEEALALLSKRQLGGQGPELLGPLAQDALGQLAPRDGQGGGHQARRAAGRPR
jgi:signal transduction histidine kinase